jgi:hypothetical protein
VLRRVGPNGVRPRASAAGPYTYDPPPGWSCLPGNGISTLDTATAGFHLVLASPWDEVVVQFGAPG